MKIKLLSVILAAGMLLAIAYIAFERRPGAPRPVAVCGATPAK